MSERTLEEIFKNDVVKPFIQYQQQKERYLFLEQEYHRLEQILLSVKTYTEKKQIEAEIEATQSQLDQHIEEFGEPAEFIINSSVYDIARATGTHELDAAYAAVESSVNEMVTLLKQAAVQYEDVLKKQLEVQKIKVRMNYLNNIETDFRNIKDINRLRYSANDYVKRGSLNHANTPEQFGNKLTAMLDEKNNKEKVYSEGL